MSYSILRVAQLLSVSTLALCRPAPQADNNPPSVIQLPSKPAAAAAAVDPDFLGLAFEQSSFVPYAQTRDGKFNTFSANLIRAVTPRTGGKP
ncbi:glycoside hydrolase family 79 protein [Apiospora phragmitis]|uniref:Glycoside hydrolase family 79 protein n=1 Tax=Apiospora phragmitis TaxID=2905665 RepID=A0ABR1T9E4_9PEZI